MDIEDLTPYLGELSEIFKRHRVNDVEMSGSFFEANCYPAQTTSTCLMKSRDDSFCIEKILEHITGEA